MPATENWRLHRARTLDEMREVFSCPYFWFGWRQAFDGAPFDPDIEFDMLRRGYDEKLAQLRYENGREAAIEAKATEFIEPWRVQFPIPLRLLAWALD